MINYGIIGVSSIAQRFVNGLKLTDEGVAYGVSSRNLDKAENFARANDLAFFTDDYQDLLKNNNIDVIYISTTNNTHYQIAKEALIAKKHTIVEKPFTMSTSQAEELFTLARSNNCFLMEGQKSVFLPTTQKIKELIKADLIGEVKYIYLPTSSNLNWSKDFWMYDLEVGGGAMMGSANYAIAFTSYLLDDTITNIQALAINHPKQADYLTSLSFQFSNGCIVNTILGMEINTINRCYIYGTKGHIFLDNFWKAKSFTLCPLNQEPQEFSFNYESEFTFYLNHVNKCINDKLLTSFVMSEKLTLACVSNVEKIYQQFKRELM